MFTRALICSCVLLSVGVSSAAAQSFVQSASANDHYATASASASFAASVTADDAIAVLCAWTGTTQSLLSVTDTQGNVYTIVDNPTSGTYGRAAMAYAIARASSADTVACNFSAAGLGKSIVVHEVSGVSTANPLDAHKMAVRTSPGTAANAVTSTNVTTTSNGAYVLGFTFNSSSNGADWNAGTGYVRRQDLRTADYAVASEDRIQPTAGAIAATFTATSFGYEFITGVMAFRPGSSASLTSIAVTPAGASIVAGATQAYIATGAYSDSSTRDLTSTAAWTSSNTSVATIAAGGAATALSAGSTTIQAASGGITGSTTLTVTPGSSISVAVSPATASVQAPFATQQFTATVTNDPAAAGVFWSLSGAGCSGASCGTLSADSSASGAAITYTAPVSEPAPASVTLTATSMSDSTRSRAATILISRSATSAGSTFTESFGDSSSLCWSGGPTTCNQSWAIGTGSGQAIVATPAPPPSPDDDQALRMIETAGSGSYLYTTGTFPRLSSGTAFDLYFTLNVSSHAMASSDVTRLVTMSDRADGSLYTAQISFGYNGSNLQLQAGGSTSSPSVNISLGAWHTIRLHVAGGTNASYLVVDGGVPNTFTENARDFAYLLVGSSAGQLDAMTYYIGHMSIDSTAGGGLAASMLIDFEGAADGTTLTTANLAASTHCGNGVWSLTDNPITGMTISTVAVKRLSTPVTTCGVQYTDSGGTKGLRYDMSQTSRYAAYNWTTTSSSASVGFFYKIDVVDSNWYSVFAITAGGHDYTMLHMHGGDMYLETWAGITNPIPMQANTWYWVTMQYNGGGTHYMNVYETARWTLVGSASNVSTGNYKPDGIEIGRTGSEPGFPTAAWYYDQIVIDYAKGTFPLLQGTPATLTSIAVTPANPSIPKGATQQFTATGTYSDGSTQNLTSSVSWGSSSGSVATISSGGSATGIGSGTATIQASSGSVAGSTTLTVTAATLSSIAVTPVNPVIAPGSTQQFTATGTYSDGSTQNLTGSANWSSSNASVATITSAGFASGVAPGASTISATSGTVSGSTTLTVTSPSSGATAYVQSASANDHYATASASARLAANVTANNAIAVFCGWTGTTQSLVSVTDTQGNSYTVVDNPTSGTYGRAAMAYAIARATAADTVSCNFSTAGLGKSIAVHEVSGVNTSAPLDGHKMAVRTSPGTAANAVTSTNITTTTSGDYVLGFTFNSSSNGADWNAGTGYVRRQDLRTAAYAVASEDRIQTTAGAIAATFTATSFGYEFITGVMAFRPR